MTLSSPVEFWNTELFDKGPVATVTECENRFEILAAGDLDDCTKSALLEALNQWLAHK